MAEDEREREPKEIERIRKDIKAIHREVSFVNAAGAGEICCQCRAIYPCETVVALSRETEGNG